MSAGERGGAAEDRRAEARAAADKLGATLQVHHFPDTRIDPADLIPALEADVRELQPRIVLCPSCRDDHQDHRAVHDAVVVATRDARCTVLAYITPSAAERFRPNWFVPLNETAMACKLAALAHHTSQRARAYLAEEYVRAMGRYWAMVERAQAPFVEPFELVRHREAP